MQIDIVVKFDDLQWARVAIQLAPGTGTLRSNRAETALLRLLADYPRFREFLERTHGIYTVLECMVDGNMYEPLETMSALLASSGEYLDSLEAEFARDALNRQQIIAFRLRFDLARKRRDAQVLVQQREQAARAATQEAKEKAAETPERPKRTGIRHLRN